MRRLVSIACITAALLLPGTAASADAGPPAGVRNCPPGWAGLIVWVWDPTTGTREDVAEVCFITGP
jgi:hypothetical protein